MRKRFFTPLILFAAMSVLAGCLYDTTLDEKGGGTMTVKYRLTSEAQLRGAKRRFQSANVTLVDADVDKDKWATFHLKFDDITKLPTAEFFAKTTFSLIDNGSGTVTLTCKYNNPDTIQLQDELLQYFGGQVAMSIQLPGDVVETNATESAGKTAKWTFPLREFSEKTEFVMTVTYKKPEGGAAAATPAGAAAAPAAP